MSDVLIPDRVPLQGSGVPTFSAARGVFYMRTTSPAQLWWQTAAPSGTTWEQLSGDSGTPSTGAPFVGVDHPIVVGEFGTIIQTVSPPLIGDNYVPTT